VASYPLGQHHLEPRGSPFEKSEEIAFIGKPPLEDFDVPMIPFRFVHSLLAGGKCGIPRIPHIVPEDVAIFDVTKFLAVTVTLPVEIYSESEGQCRGLNSLVDHIIEPNKTMRINLKKLVPSVTYTTQ